MITRARFTVLALGLGLSACASAGDSQSLLRSAVDEKQPSLTSCYEAALERDSSVEGAVRARLHIDPSSGSVREVEVLRSTLGDATLEACMSSALTGIRLAEAPSADVTIDYDFQLVREPAGGARVAQQ